MVVTPVAGLVVAVLPNWSLKYGDPRMKPHQPLSY
jgi:hypothetical protein